LQWASGTRQHQRIAFPLTIHPHIADAIGNFSETLLNEMGFDRHATFTERARTVHARLRADLDHRHFSGIEVFRELARRDPRADARMPFTFNSVIGQVGADGSALELFGPEVYTSSQTPQVRLNGFAFEQHGGLVVQFDEVAGLFPDGHIAAAVTGYAGLLDELTGEARPRGRPGYSACCPRTSASAAGRPTTPVAPCRITCCPPRSPRRRGARRTRPRSSPATGR
jgi:hypothetical protein